MDSLPEFKIENSRVYIAWGDSRYDLNSSEELSTKLKIYEFSLQKQDQAPEGIASLILYFEEGKDPRLLGLLKKNLGTVRELPVPELPDRILLRLRVKKQKV